MKMPKSRQRKTLKGIRFELIVRVRSIGWVYKAFICSHDLHFHAHLHGLCHSCSLVLVHDCRLGCRCIDFLDLFRCDHHARLCPFDRQSHMIRPSHRLCRVLACCAHGLLGYIFLSSHSLIGCHRIGRSWRLPVGQAGSWEPLSWGRLARS